MREYEPLWGYRADDLMRPSSSQYDEAFCLFEKKKRKQLKKSWHKAIRTHWYWTGNKKSYDKCVWPECVCASPISLPLTILKRRCDTAELPWCLLAPLRQLPLQLKRLLHLRIHHGEVWIQCTPVNNNRHSARKQQCTCMCERTRTCVCASDENVCEKQAGLVLLQCKFVKF